MAWQQHGGQPFQVPTFWGTELFIGDLKRIQELADAPESSLSAKIATNQMAGLIWAFPDSFTDNSLRWSVIGEHVHQLVRKNLTQTVSKLIPSIMEEVEIVMDRVIGETPQGEFKSFKAHDTALKVVGQITNKVIVGAPLCRNTNFLQAVIDHGVSVCMGGQLIRLFPESIKRYVAKYLTTVSKATDAVVTHIAPIIRDLYERSRTENIDLLEGQPGYQTLTYWLTQRAIQKGFDWSPRMIATQLLFVNFGGIHTTAAAVGHLFYELGLRPEYIEPLKKEIEEKVAEHGWTKEGLDAMWKLDSFLRETQRLHPLSTAGLWRYARKDFTFSDGFHVPAGTWISAVSETLNKDDKHYANGTTFDGFRFARARETEGDKVKLTTTGILNMGFGTGSHACPGRFMAALELKLIVSHLVLNYEIRLEQGTRPVDFRMNVSTLPNISGKVLLRKKVVLKE